MAFNYQWPAIPDATENQLLTTGLINKVRTALESLYERFAVGHSMSDGTHTRKGLSAVISFYGDAADVTTNPHCVTGSGYNVDETHDVGVTRTAEGVYRITFTASITNITGAMIKANSVSSVMMSSTAKASSTTYIDIYVADDSGLEHDITQYEYVSVGVF